MRLRKLLCCSTGYLGSAAPLISYDIELIKVFQRQPQEIMFISPYNLAFSKSLALGRGRRRIGDLGDKIGCRCFGNTIHQDTNERGLQYDGESKRKAKQYTFTIIEPAALLVGSEFDTLKVRLKLKCKISICIFCRPEIWRIKDAPTRASDFARHSRCEEI